MEMPEQFETETFGEYQQRLHLPHIYTPFFPGDPGGEQVQWQQDLQAKFPVLSFYPYDTLNVSKANEMVYVVFEDKDHITELAREAIVRFCSLYGREHAEKVIPSVEELKRRYFFHRKGNI